MANGKPGDNPYTDIVVHGLEAISPEVTRLVKRITGFGDARLNEVTRDLVWDMRPELANDSWRPILLRDLERDLRNLAQIGEELKTVTK